jgi:hypothetical protein
MGGGSSRGRRTRRTRARRFSSFTASAQGDGNALGLTGDRRGIDVVLGGTRQAGVECRRPVMQQVATAAHRKPVVGLAPVSHWN